MKPALVVTVLLVYARSVFGMYGSCRAAGKCCDGKDTECEVKVDQSSNDIVLNWGAESCYCDAGCLDMGDCCHDYKDFCGVRDCEVSPWSAWSACESTVRGSSCGQGVSKRKRRVTRPESNGGVSCPDLHQSRVCHITCPDPEETRDDDATSRARPQRLYGKKHQASSALRETAMILPGKYSQANNEVSADRYDVRENLKTFHREEESTDQYCVVFRVEKAMKSCQLNEDTKRLVHGADICVSCESKSTRPHLGDRCTGHGVEDKITRFKNVITPRCHGKWIKTGVYDKCPCVSGADFIFV